MHRDEQIGLRLIGDIRPLIERKVVVGSAREDNLRPQARLQQLAQSPGHVQHQIFFQQSFAAHRAQIPAAMSGVEGDAEFSNRGSELLVLRFHAQG